VQAYYDLGVCGPFREQTLNLFSLCGQFKVPTLRNIALTAPYFHNGRFNSLQDAIGFYVRRDTNPEQWYPTAADGSVTKFDDLPAIYGGQFVVQAGVAGLGLFDAYPRSMSELSDRLQAHYPDLDVRPAARFVGPIIGAVLMVFALVLLSELTKAWLLYLGLAFVLMVLYAPGGIASLVLANVKLARQGGLRLLWSRYLLLLLAALPLLFGAAVLIEMIYHLQQGTALGSGMRFAGITLDVHAPTDWAAVTVTFAVGACAFELARRVFVERWDAVQHALSKTQLHLGAT